MRLMFLLLAACTGASDMPVPLAGTVTAETGEAADVVSATAFGVKVGGTAGILVSPNPDSTCADAADFLLSSDVDFNPEVLSGEGVCNVYLRLDAYTGEEVTLVDDASATVSLNCAMDAGSWEFEERNDEGYFYTGPWWVGSPDAYTLTVSGGDTSDFTVSLEMDSYYGRFPYDEDEPEADLATGAVAGTFTATWCEDLAPAFD